MISASRPGGATVFIVKKGGSLGVPKWQFNIGAQYDFALFDHPTFIRGDYQYSGSYLRGQAPGTAAYNAVTANGEATNFATARAGMTFDQIQAAIYVNNLTASKSILNEGNGLSSPLRTATTFRPREFGFQVSYRY